MNQTPVLMSAMHGVESEVTFAADRDGDVYALSLTKDGTLVVADTSVDGATMLHRSTDRRHQLQQMGYAAKPLPQRTPHLVSGPCWGPGRPLETELLGPLSR